MLSLEDRPGEVERPTEASPVYRFYLSTISRGDEPPYTQVKSGTVQAADQSVFHQIISAIKVTLECGDADRVGIVVKENKVPIGEVGDFLAAVFPEDEAA